jgi:hypothetical protein
MPLFRSRTGRARRDRVAELMTEPPSIYNSPRLTGDQTIAIWSVPVTVHPRHPWAHVPCLVCRQTPGVRPVRLVVFSGGRIVGKSYIRAATAGYLVHTEHGDQGDDDLYQLAHRLESPGCQCSASSPVVAATNPHHERITA